MPNTWIIIDLEEGATSSRYFFSFGNPQCPLVVGAVTILQFFIKLKTLFLVRLCSLILDDPRQGSWINFQKKR